MRWAMLDGEVHKFLDASKWRWGSAGERVDATASAEGGGGGHAFPR